MKNCESFKGFGYNNNNNISSSLTMADEVILFDLKSELIKVEGEKSRQSRTKNNLTKSILKNIFLNKVEQRCSRIHANLGVIFRYSRSIENGAPCSHIYSEVRPLKLW